MEVPSLSLGDYDGFIFDADDTLLLSGENIAEGSLGLHNLSRKLAAQRIAETYDLEALFELPDTAYASAYHRSPYHTSEGANHQLLVDAGVFEKDREFDPDDTYVKAMTAVKDKEYSGLMVNLAEPVPGSLEFVSKLHQVGFAGALAIATTARLKDIKSFNMAQGFAQYIPPEFIVAIEDTKKPKPEPEAYLTAASFIGVSEDKLHRVGVFEDHPRGIAAARKAGMIVHGLATVYSEKDLMELPIDVRPHYVAKDFNGYLDLFGLRQPNKEYWKQSYAKGLGALATLR
jgi:HAD superfamily hydrolase (TIGR01509 family)